MIALAAASGDPEALHAADGLALWLGSDVATLEAALGLPATWRSADRRRRRDDLYAKIAQMNVPGLKGAPLARAVAAEIDRYQTSSWPRDRANGRRPGGANAMLFDILNLGERFLLDIEALRKLPGISSAFEYQNQALHSGEQEETRRERDDGQNFVFEGCKSG
jgi:hypothetical protein